MQMNLSDRTAVDCLTLKITKPAARLAGELAKPMLLALVFLITHSSSLS
jgi:hypothetical protein